MKSRLLERFRAKHAPDTDPGWKPVRRPETRQIINLEPRSDSVRSGSALSAAVLGLSFALSSPAMAKTNWTVNFSNDAGRSVWVVGFKDDGIPWKVPDGGHYAVQWKEDGCPPSWAQAYFVVYAAEKVEEEDRIFEANYKYKQGAANCILQYTGDAWYNDYDQQFKTEEKKNENHKRRLWLKGDYMDDKASPSC